jgi:hypothetical protein
VQLKGKILLLQVEGYNCRECQDNKITLEREDEKGKKLHFIFEIIRIKFL